MVISFCFFPFFFFLSFFFCLNPQPRLNKSPLIISDKAIAATVEIQSSMDLNKSTISKTKCYNQHALDQVSGVLNFEDLFYSPSDNNTLCTFNRAFKGFPKFRAF